LSLGFDDIYLMGAVKEMVEFIVNTVFIDFSELHIIRLNILYRHNRMIVYY